MSDQQIKSVAFRNVELESEHLRIFGVLGFVGIFVAVTLLRVFVIGTASKSTPWIGSLSLAGAIICYEVTTLRNINEALADGRIVPGGFWIASTIIETSLPAVVLAFLTNPEIPTAYRPIASPAILVCFIFNVLSTLRLSSWIGALSAIGASISYLCAALYLGWRPPLLGTAAEATQSVVSLNAVVLLVGGIVAGMVAGEIRKHIQAALREAETKRRLEAVEHDLQLARPIQQSLLPQQIPEIHGFDIAGWNRPADDTGEDYFDWNTLPDGKVIVSMADVTGHKAWQ
jgi:hypothetical protein